MPSSALHRPFHLANHTLQVLSQLRFLDLYSCIQVDACSLRRFEGHALSLLALGLECCARVDSASLLSLDRLFRDLVCLDLEATALCDRGLQHVLERAPKLERLYIGGCRVTGSAFADARPGCQRALRTLCVRLTDFAWSHAVDLARVAPDLRVLLVSADRAAQKEGEPSVCGFREVLPGCRVVPCNVVEEQGSCGHFLAAAVRRRAGFS